MIALLMGVVGMIILPAMVMMLVYRFETGIWLWQEGGDSHRA